MYPQSLCTLRGQDGGCSAGLRQALRSGLTGGLPGREEQGVGWRNSPALVGGAGNAAPGGLGICAQWDGKPVLVAGTAGRRGIRVTDRRCATDFAQMLWHLSQVVYAQAAKIVLVLDNLNTHGPQSLYEQFDPEAAGRLAERFEWHYTPEHGSWLNVAECELSVLERQCLSRGIGERADLEREVAAWQSERNAHSVCIRWQFRDADARLKLRRLYPVLHSNTG